MENHVRIKHSIHVQFLTLLQVELPRSSQSSASDLDFLVPLQMLRDGVELPDAAAILGQHIGCGQVPHDFSTEVHEGPAVIHTVDLRTWNTWQVGPIVLWRLPHGPASCKIIGYKRSL